MRPPTDKSYKLPISVLVGLLVLGIGLVYIGAKMLQDRAKHAWPW